MIGADVREQNKLLSDIDGSMDSAGGLLGGTMKRLGLLSKGDGGCTLVYLAAFVFFVFVVLFTYTYYLSTTIIPTYLIYLCKRM